MCHIAQWIGSVLLAQLGLAAQAAATFHSAEVLNGVAVASGRGATNGAVASLLPLIVLSGSVMAATYRTMVSQFNLDARERHQ
jgi:hypothetical protein